MGQAQSAVVSLLAALASAQRVVLREAHRAATMVSRAGVRVEHRVGEQGGEALGVGKMSMADFAQVDKVRRAFVPAFVAAPASAPCDA